MRLPMNLRLDLPLMRRICPRVYQGSPSAPPGQARRAIRVLGTQTPAKARQTYVNPVPDLQRSNETNHLSIQVDVVHSVATPGEVSLPALIYFYGPWSLLASKLSLLKLKILRDWAFSEAKFVENSSHGALIITDFIRRKRARNVERCSTPMGYKQISHDLIDGTHDWRLQMMRFERRHIHRVIPLKVQLLQHYGHKFAFIDVVYVALRRSNDFSSSKDLEEVYSLMRQNANNSSLVAAHPLIFAEIFVRFRRDYSVKPTRMGNVRENSRCMGQWLVSTYKILQFDLIDHHPQFDIPLTGGHTVTPLVTQ
ncbi:GL11282 [Drosophila persimilis]|uniref:GL11282 n=1 Tax=Drosophila persimilis TaxID=7234 RepID=B4G9Z9_DROPE|nr:uncharacterized protein LOC6590316 [Drosophila persimilis]EDW31751.1 GL11282 [Drosophila persimilis]